MFDISVKNGTPITTVETISHDLPFIDLVRGGSSILVAAAHVGISIWPKLIPAWFSLGALAVDLFMIVSGFLMTLSLCDKGQPKSLTKSNLASFYIRRYFRISPAFYVAYGLSFAISPTTLLSAILHLTYLNGLSPVYSVDGIIVPFWSISLEMQFYLVIPFILAAFRYINASFVLAACCFVGVIASQLFGIYERAPGLLGSFPLPSFLPLSIGFFVMGILLALHFLKSPHAPPKWGSILLIVGAILPHPEFKHVYLAAGGTLAVLLWMSPPRTMENWTLSKKKWLSSMLQNPVIAKLAKLIADYSYSLYLFHTFLIILLFKQTHAFFWLDPVFKPFSFLIATVAVIGMSYFISFVVLRWIEKPGIWIGKRLERKLGFVHQSRTAG